MNKFISSLTFLLVLACSLDAQNNVGIGTLNPNQKAILELSASDKGFLLPRVTGAQRLAISPAQGSDESLLVYDLNDSSFYYWDAIQWRRIGDVSDAYNIALNFDANTNTLSITDYGSTLSTILNINVDDADSNPTNELQTLIMTQTANTVNWNLSLNGGSGAFNTDDNDWAGAGSGTMYPFHLTDKIGIGLNNPRMPLEVAIDVSNGHLRPGSTVLRLTNKENVTCPGETFWDFRVGECGQLGIVTNLANANSGFGNFNILNSTDSLLSPGIVASFSTNAPPQSFFVYPAGQPRVAIRDTIDDHALFVFDKGEGNAAFFSEEDAGNGIEVFESGDGQGVIINESGAGNALVIEEFDNGGGILITERGTGTGLFINQSAGENVSTPNGYGILLTSTGTNEPVYVNHNGNIAILSTSGVWTNASDSTLKKNIEPLVYGLNEVLLLKPVHYQMKSNDASQIGFIAQEVQNIIPEVVELTADNKLTMSYGNLVALITNAIQEQQAFIEKLQTENHTILKSFETLKNEFTLIKSYFQMSNN